MWPLAGPRPKGKPQGARAPLTALPGSREGAILNRQTFYLDAEDTYQGIKDVDMVPSLSARNLECIRIGKDFMFSHGYIENDFDVAEWARPEFLEQAAEEVLKEEWERRSWSKLPAGGGLEVEGTRLG